MLFKVKLPNTLTIFLRLLAFITLHRCNSHVQWNVRLKFATVLNLNLSISFWLNFEYRGLHLFNELILLEHFPTLSPLIEELFKFPQNFATSSIPWKWNFCVLSFSCQNWIFMVVRFALKYSYFIRCYMSCLFTPYELNIF